MKNINIAMAILAIGIVTTTSSHAQAAPTPPAAPNILQLELGPDGSAVVEGGKVKVVSRQGDVTILSPAAPSVAAAPAVNNGCGRPPAVLTWQPAPAPVAPAPAQHVCGGGGCNGGRQDLIGAVGRPVMSVVRAPFQLVGGVANVIGGGGCN